MYPIQKNLFHIQIYMDRKYSSLYHLQIISSKESKELLVVAGRPEVHIYYLLFSQQPRVAYNNKFSLVLEILKNLQAFVLLAFLSTCMHVVNMV